jgi:hypothetical protein
MQLADRCEALRAGHSLVFYDATFHGASDFADGSIDANVDRINMNASTSIGIDASEDMFLHTGTDFHVQANQDANIDIFRDADIDISRHLMIDVTQNATVTIGGNALFSAIGILNLGGSQIDFMGGFVRFSTSGISLGTSTSHPTEVRGGFTAMHNATFLAGKTVSLLGTTNASDLTATALKGTVSNAAGITYSGAGRAHYRDRLMTSADMAGGPFWMHPDTADFFYVTALTSPGNAKIDTGGSSINGDVIEVSTLGMTGGFSLTIYAADETTVLLTMTATNNSWAKWKRMSTGLWRLIGVSDG